METDTQAPTIEQFPQLDVMNCKTGVCFSLGCLVGLLATLLDARRSITQTHPEP